MPNARAKPRAKPRASRGRASSIETLPEDVKQLLDRLLRKKSIPQTEIVAAINEKLTEAGVGKRVSKSALNRYSTRMEAVGARLREAREVAEAWTAKFGEQPTGEVSQMIIEILRTLAFDLTLKADASATDEDDKAMDPKLLSQLALAVQRLERAADMSTKRERELRKAFAEEAAAQMDEAAREQGLSAEAVAAIKSRVLGV